MEKKIVPIIESYNTEEEYLYSKTYLYIKGMAAGCNFVNTLKALPLARKMHNGQYRKGTVEVANQRVHLPYILHPLKVCSTLISLNLPLEHDELDILYATAILHDVVEDAEQYFPKGGIELVTDYGFPQEVYDIILLLSKHSGADAFELNEYFNKIKKNRLALLVKMADRSHNVEDLYNMKVEKLHKYVRETREYVYPLSSYAKQNYPELSNGVTILKSKIVSLTELTETIVDMYIEKITDLEVVSDALATEIKAKNNDIALYESDIKTLEDKVDELNKEIKKLKRLNKQKLKDVKNDKNTD